MSACLLAMGLCMGAWAQPVPVATAAAAPVTLAPIPVEAFFQWPKVMQVKLSPSGRQLALTTSRNNNRVGLVVITLGGSGEAPTAGYVAGFSDADITHFDWVGDKRLVFSAIDLQAGSGEDYRLAPGLYAVDADGSQMRQLVKRRGRQFFVDGNVIDRTLEWNHILLATPKQQPGVASDEVLIGHMDFIDKRVRQITPMWLNTRTGRTHSAAVFGAPSQTVAWKFDSRGEPRLAVTYDEGRQRVHWRAPGESQWRLISESDLLTPPFHPVDVDDAGTLYLTYGEGARGDAVLSVFDFEKGAPQKPGLVSTPGFDYRGNLVLDRPGGRALGVTVETDAEQTIWFDPEMKQLQALVDDKLPGRVNRLSCRRCGADDMVVLVRSFSDRDPGRLYLYEAADQRWKFISTVLDDIDPRRMATVDLHRITARDGRDLPVWLTIPPGVQPGHPAPAVVLVHGGPWARIGHWQWQAMEQFLASRGYLVISPEFRGSTGYGDAHYRAGWKQWGQSMQDDVADALLWARAQGWADKERACIAGASYGGYATLMGLVRNPELYRCGVAWAAVTDPFLFIQGSWWVDDDISGDGRKYYLQHMVGDAEKDAAMLTAASPVAQAKRIQAPLLLAFGESDRRVPIAHGRRLREALTDAGHPPEWVSYPNEGHGWRLMSNQIDWAQRVEKFLAQHLQADSKAEVAH
ncbi:alpha/beta hydrolase family protein [Roseateles koreensis]|uniref:alpha/beta hydrolase family protein n=1 Tax=Roseateles koreensis TaxID=2987526 RepID=UPI002358BD89